MSALGYLITRSLANSLVHRIKRLRQPKYLLGAALAVAYIYFYFYKFLYLAAGASPGLKGVAGGGSIYVGATMLFVGTLMLAWVLPSSRAAINFTEAEIAFLFPAPLKRRTLIIFKILRSQIGLLFISVFFTLITGRWRMGGDAWTRTASWWLILNTFALHRLGASFALSRLYAHGLADWKRRVFFVAVVAGFALLVWQAWTSLPLAPAGPVGAFSKVTQLAESRTIQWVLVPFKLVVAPYYAHGLREFAAAVFPALGILLAHFLWVVRADASFEDAAIENARRRAKLIASAQKGDVRFSTKSGKARVPLFRLRATGFQATAFLWKSLIRIGGKRTLSRWALFFLALAATAVWLNHRGLRDPSAGLIALVVAIGGACYIALIISFVMVGQQAAGQLRQGIAGMDLLKTYPLSGWQFALGELLGPVVVGTLIQWAALGVGTTLALTFIDSEGHALGRAWIPIAGVAVFLPLFNLGTSILPAAAALALPGWFKPADVTNGAPGGLEVVGLRLLMGIMQILLILLAFIPVAFFGAAAWVAAGMFGIDFAWKVAATASTAGFVLALEAASGIAWLGWLFDRFDLSGE